MKKKPPITPRKAPKQDRSQSLVDVILTATSRVLESLGIDRSTTSRIAEKAGVSIGSLYQYFPNKEALIAAVIERQVDKHTREIEEEIASLGHEKIEVVITTVVRKVSEVFLKRRKLILAVQAHAPTLGKIDVILLARRRIGKVVRKLLQDRQAELRTMDLDQAAFITVNAVMGIVDIAILDFPEFFDEKSMEREIRELARRYLVAQPPN